MLQLMLQLLQLSWLLTQQMSWLLTQQMRPKADVVQVRPGLIDEWPGPPGHRLAKIWIFKNGLIGTLTAPIEVPISSPSGKFSGDAKYGPPG